MTPRRDPRQPAPGGPPGAPRAVLAIALALTALPAAGGPADPPARDRPAATARRLEPPRGADAEAYLKLSRAAGLQGEIDYLAPDSPFDADLPKPERPPAGDAFAGIAPEWRGVAWAVLAAIAAGLIGLGLRYRHVLAELFAADRALGPAGSGPSPPAAPAIDHDLLARLRAEADPRAGLRLLLARFLALAARENALVLRRGLTTREVLRALPGGWRHRGDLERLAERVELSVFGGRAMERAAYLECLELAAPLLFRVGPERGPGGGPA